MWEKLQRAAQHPVMQFLKKLCGDPVQLYVLLLMTTIMQYYHSEFTWLYTIISVFLSWGMMRFYDFVAKHKYIGPLCYLAYFAAGIFLVMVLSDIGMTYYPIGFAVWFLTPQSVVDFSLWYTMAIFLLMLGFLSSAVYYFAKTRYRMVMQFLLMLIPLSLYAKEGIQAPAHMVILTLCAYFLLMVYCRQLRGTPDVRRLPNMQTGMSVTIYVLLFSILAAVVPKPAIRADREFIENSMAQSSLSDVLMAAISMFTDTASSGGVNTLGEGRTVYYAAAMEPLRLRTQTFSYYSEDDTWHSNDVYDHPGMDYDAYFAYAPVELMNTILQAAALDEEFAETYGLSDLKDTVLPDQYVRELALVPNLYSSRVLPIPTRVAGLEEFERATKVSVQGTITPDGYSYDRGSIIRLTYYTDVYPNEPAVRSFLSRMQADTYAAMMTDAVGILAWENPEGAALLEGCLAEREQVQAFYEDTMNNDWQSDVIDALAAEITAGLTSDYEKAKAIERYFTANGFIYDDSYEKPEGDNTVTFLTETKRGVCYEYATAMVLLCRAAGLPARYAQGYSMSDPYENEFDTPFHLETNFVIKLRDSHAFPEVYISGYGWLSFEPTVTSEDNLNGTAENYYVMLWGFVILGIAVLAFAVYLMLPVIREKLFRRKLSDMTPREAAAAVFIRMRSSLQLADSVTVMELASYSEAFSSDEAMQQFYAVLDALLYDERENAASDVSIPMLYVQWQTSRSAYEKAEKKRLKENKKQKSELQEDYK